MRLHQEGAGLDVLSRQPAADGRQPPDGLDSPLHPALATATGDGLLHHQQSLHTTRSKGNRRASWRTINDLTIGQFDNWTIAPPKGGRGVLSPPEGRLRVQMFLYRMVSPAIVRPLTKIVVPLHCLRKTGRRACICRLQEATCADSRDQHVQTPEAAKTRRKTSITNNL